LPPALCYVNDWYVGFAVLTAYRAGTYKPGMERDIESLSSGQDNEIGAVVQKLLSDYNQSMGRQATRSEKTFAEIYQDFYADKYESGKKFSDSSKYATKAAFKNCLSLHDKPFRLLKAADLQNVLDTCGLKHASLEHIKNLLNQMYRYADGQGLCDKRYDQFITIKTDDDDEHGVPFTDEELNKLWEHVKDPIVESILILCYSGWRITEFINLTVNLEEKYFCGGMKTAAGKNRIVPIHHAIFPLVKRRIYQYKCLVEESPVEYRKCFTKALTDLNMAGTPRHTPHDCRHTFSRLCEKYGVRENDQKRMLGHAFSDVTNKVYGHRDLESLRKELEKIVTNV